MGILKSCDLGLKIREIAVSFVRKGSMAQGCNDVPLSYKNLVVSVIENASQISLSAVRTGPLPGTLDFLSPASRAATKKALARMPTQPHSTTYAFGDLLVTRLCSFEVAIIAESDVQQQSFEKKSTTPRRGADNAVTSSEFQQMRWMRL